MAIEVVLQLALVDRPRPGASGRWGVPVVCGQHDHVIPDLSIEVADQPAEGVILALQHDAHLATVHVVEVTDPIRRLEVGEQQVGDIVRAVTSCADHLDQRVGLVTDPPRIVLVGGKLSLTELAASADPRITASNKMARYRLGVLAGDVLVLVGVSLLAGAASGWPETVRSSFA